MKDNKRKFAFFLSEEGIGFIAYATILFKDEYFIKWLKKEVENKPVEILQGNEVIGEIKDIEITDEKISLISTMYGEPIPIITKYNSDISE